jgi:hypothetical protein
VGEGSATGDSETEPEGAVLAAEASGADEVGAVGDEAEAADPIEPVANDDGAVGEELGVAVVGAPDRAGAVVVGLPRAASAI